MKMMPTKFSEGLDPLDWLVELFYVNWFDRERRKVIGITGGVSKDEAISMAVNSLRRKIDGAHQYPKAIRIQDVRRRFENKIKTKFSGIHKDDEEAAVAAFMRSGELQVVGTKPT